jgi:hypothetical protein
MTARGNGVFPPSIRSNLAKDVQQEATFNSIGFYADLMDRLNKQIETTEAVFLKCQYKMHHEAQLMAQESLPREMQVRVERHQHLGSDCQNEHCHRTKL